MNEREEAIEAMAKLPRGSRTIVIGASDTGKSTFAVQLINAMMLRGQFPISVVDSDIGQSEIGPPGVVGLGALLAEPPPMPLKSLLSVPYGAGGFVGATSPSVSPLDWLTATVHMINVADRVAPHHVVIDTPGYIYGVGMAALKSLLAMARPNLVLAFAFANELEPIVRPFSRLSIPNLTVLGLPIAKEAIPKTADIRTTRRAARYLEHLQGALTIHLLFDQIVFQNTAFTYGEPQLPHLLRFIGQTLGGECVYAEKQADRSLTVIMSENPKPKKISNTGPLEMNFNVNKVYLTGTSRFIDLMIGLYGVKGNFLDIGIIRAMDYERRRMEILTRVKHPSAIAKIAMGYIRLKPDGREIEQFQAGQAI